MSFVRWKQNVREELDRYRKQNDLRWDELGKKIGYSQAHISRVFGPKADPDYIYFSLQVAEAITRRMKDDGFGWVYGEYLEYMKIEKIGHAEATKQLDDEVFTIIESLRLSAQGKIDDLNRLERLLRGPKAANGDN